MRAEKELQKIANEIARCKLCKIGTVGKPVPGEGSVNSQIVFLGEAPGREEAKTGRPFVGRSGKLLRQLIDDIGLKEEDVFITSPVKYLPVRGTPTAQDIKHGTIHLIKQLCVLKPRIIVLLGAVAGKAVLETPLAVKLHHGTVVKRKDVNYFITYHPAAALRFSPLKQELEKDFKKLQKLIQIENVYQ